MPYIKKGELYLLNTDTYRLGKQIIEALNKKKIIKVDLLDVAQITPLAELFIIAIASNIRQTKAMADEVEESLAKLNKLPIHKEGYQSANWILLDYGDIIVHILDEEHAQFYGLTRLWQDAISLEI